MIVYPYVRVSHKTSAEQGLSIETQIEAALRYMAHSIPDATLSDQQIGDYRKGFFVDAGVSGWSKSIERRPAGRKILDLAQPGDHIVFYSIDRMARNVRDFSNYTHYFDSKGIYAHYICDQINTASATGKLQANIRAAVAQYHSDITSERTREALLIKRMRETRTLPKESTKKKVWIPSDFLKVASMGKGNRNYPGTIYRYERVSSDSQYTSGLGLEHQSKSNRRAAEALSSQTGQSIHYEALVDPAVSAFSVPFKERKAGRWLMQHLQEGDTLVVYKLDRAWRNTIDAVRTCEELKKRGVGVYLVTENINTSTREGEEWIGLLASIAQQESGLKSQRCKDVREYRQARGLPVGTMPVGFTGVSRGDGVTKIVLDEKKAKDAMKVYILAKELELCDKQINDTMLAWKAQETKRRATLKLKKRYYNREHIRYVEHLQEKLPDTLFNRLMNEAREMVRQPIDPEYWCLNKWEWMYNEGAVA